MKGIRKRRDKEKSWEVVKSQKKHSAAALLDFSVDKTLGSLQVVRKPNLRCSASRLATLEFASCDHHRDGGIGKKIVRKRTKKHTAIC